jgi:hypothetical protein
MGLESETGPGEDEGPMTWHSPATGDIHICKSAGFFIYFNQLAAYD